MSAGAARMLASDLLHVARENRDALELFNSQQPRAQAIVDIVIVVRDFVGEVRQLRFERRPLALHEALANFAEHARVFKRAMFQYAFAGFETQVKPVECSVALLE